MGWEVVTPHYVPTPLLCSPSWLGCPWAVYPARIYLLLLGGPEREEQRRGKGGGAEGGEGGGGRG